MTISKAYSLLRGGRPARTQSRQADDSGEPVAEPSQLPKRLQQIDPLVEQTVLAAKQLQLSEAELVKSRPPRMGARR